MSEIEYWDGTGVEASVLEAHVRQLAAEQPEYVYNPKSFPDTGSGARCKYTHTLEDGSKVPGCIIGQAIFNITGKPVDQWRDSGGVLDFKFMRDAELDNFAGDWSDRAKWLANVQSHQDRGISWGEAVRRADDPNEESNLWSPVQKNSSDLV